MPDSPTNNSSSPTSNSSSPTSNSSSPPSSSSPTTITNSQNLTGTLADLSGISVPPIVNLTLNERLDVSGTTVVNRQGSAADGTGVTHTTFVTNAPEDVDISANLVGLVQHYYNDVDPNSPTNVVLQQIKTYAAQIQCSDFQGKGSIDDYTQLFQAASQIANEANQMKLDVDLEGFNEFGQAADDLSALFNSFIVKLQNVSIIDDLDFLRTISAALAKIVNLSNVFGKFKETIIATSSVQVPKSAHDAAELVNNVMNEVKCAMGYIQNFVAPGTSPVLPDSQLSLAEKNVINKAVDTIDSWSVLCSQGVTIAMGNNPDIISMTNNSKTLKSQTTTLKSYTNILKTKLAIYNIK